MSDIRPPLDVGAAITRVTTAVGERVLDVRLASGLSAIQLQVLRLAENGASMSELISRLDAPKSSLTSVVDQLESLGLATRSTDESDRRRQLVLGTALGLARLHEFDDALTARVDRLLQALGPEKASRLRKLLAKLPDATSPVPLAGPR
ncbi:MAG TPA: MarR family transcriptional regulator [Galbitalea sp.]|jgi:DNA-binding MarR family transcriptional regulator